MQKRSRGEDYPIFQTPGEVTLIAEAQKAIWHFIAMDNNQEAVKMKVLHR